MWNLKDYDFDSREFNTVCLGQVMRTFFLKGTILITILLSINSNAFSSKYKMYEIKKGETLWRISKTYGITLDELCKINSINDAAKVRSGTKIKVPVINDNAKIKVPNLNIQYKVHYLKKNETLWQISRKYEISITDLCRINNIRDNSKVIAGMKIKVPVRFEYLEYKLPANGDVSIFKTSHFTGVHIFTGTNNIKRKIYSIDQGFVSYIDNIPGYGITVFIKHNNGLISTYSGFGHIYVKKGDRIKKDQIIGLAGNLSRYDKYGILFSIQDKGNGLKFDIKKQKFIRRPI